MKQEILEFQKALNQLRNEYERGFDPHAKDNVRRWMGYDNNRNDMVIQLQAAVPQLKNYSYYELARKDADLLKMAQDAEKVKVEREVSAPTDQPIEKKSRGRKKVEIEFPKTKFSIPELAKSLGVSNSLVYLKVLDKLKDKTIKFVEEKRAEGQRGRATKYYQTI